MSGPSLFVRLRVDRAAKYWHRLWSVRLALLAAIVSVLGEILPLWQPWLAAFPYAVLSTLLAVLAAISRIVHQGQVQAVLDENNAIENAAGSTTNNPSEAQS